MVLGTPNHLPPEVLRGEPADARSDVWAFGIVLYEMASGQLPLPRRLDGRARERHRERRRPRRLSGRVPVGIQAVIAPLPGEGADASAIAHGGEVRAALEALELGAAQRRAAARLAPSAWVRAAVVAAIVALAAGAWFFGLAIGRPARREVARRGDPTPRSAPSPSSRSPTCPAIPEQEYFADGMTEELITELAPIPPLKVISRTSVMRFKDSKEPPARDRAGARRRRR